MQDRKFTKKYPDRKPEERKTRKHIKRNAVKQETCKGKDRRANTGGPAGRKTGKTAVGIRQEGRQET
jgi:hypothetical protein